MATVHKEISVEAAPAEVWAAVRDVGAVHDRLVPGLVVATTLDGDLRTVTFANGMVVRERIVTVDDDARRLVYAATGGRATHHNASLQVLTEGPGRSRLVWITDLLPAEAAGPIRALVEQGASIMKATLERGRAGRDASAVSPDLTNR
jgi:carbon monoxide dehydrogenase subunit G